MHYLKQGC